MVTPLVRSRCDYVCKPHCIQNLLRLCHYVFLEAMSSQSSSSDYGPHDQRERHDQTQEPWLFPSTHDQPPEGYYRYPQYSSQIPWRTHRMPRDFRSTPGLVQVNLPKDRYAPPAPTNLWGPRDDYLPPHLGARATDSPLPVRTDPSKKPFDDNDEQLNRDIRKMLEKIDRLMAKHKAESEVSLQTTLSEIEHIRDQTIEHAIRRGAVIDDKTFQRLASRLQGEPDPPGQTRVEHTKAQEYRLQRREERLRAGDRSAGRQHVWWQEDRQHQPAHSETKNVEMGGALPVPSRRTAGPDSRHSKNVQIDASNSHSSQYVTGIPRPLFGNEQNRPTSQWMPLSSAPKEAPTPPPPARTYQPPRAETGKKRESRKQVPSRSPTKLSEPLRESWTHPHAQDQDTLTGAKSPEKSENGPKSKGTHPHHRDPAPGEVRSELRDQGQWSSEKTPKRDGQDSDTAGYDVLQGKGSPEQGGYRASYVSDDHDEALDSVEETGSRRQIPIAFADNDHPAFISLNQATNSSTDYSTLPPQISQFLVEPSSPVAPEIAPVAPTSDGSALYSDENQHRPSMESVKKQSHFSNQPLLPGIKAIEQNEPESRNHNPFSRRFKQKLYDAMFDALCDASHVLQTPTMPGTTAIIPAMPMMPQVVVPLAKLPKRRPGFRHAYKSSDEGSEKSTNRTPHHTRRYRGRREKSGPSTASDISRVHRPSNTSYAPDDLQGSTHHQGSQIQSLLSFPPYNATPTDSPGRLNDKRRCEQHCSTPMSISAADQGFNDDHEKVLSRHLEMGGREARNGNASDSDSDQSFQTASTGGSRRGSVGRNGDGVLESPRAAIHVSQSLTDETGGLAQERSSESSAGDSRQYREPFNINTSPFNDDLPSVPTPPSLSEEGDDSRHSPTRGVRIGEPTMLMIQTTSPSYYLVPLSDDTHHLAVAVHHHGPAKLSNRPSRIPTPVSTSRIRQQRHQKYRDEGTESSRMSNESY